MQRRCPATFPILSHATSIDKRIARKFCAAHTLVRAAAAALLLSASAGATAADAQPPSVPTGLKVVAVTDDSVTLAWNGAGDNVDVAGYTVYMNNAVRARTAGTLMMIGNLNSGTTYQWRVSAYDDASNHSGWTATPVATTTKGAAAEPPPTAPTGGNFACTFAASAKECGFGEQAKASGRATLTNVARDGSTAVLLRTLPGDSNVFGSGSAERNDLALSQAATGCTQGATQWWAHSVRFPNEYIIPPSGGTWHWGLVFNFHHTGPTGQANVQVVSLPTGLEFWVAGGTAVVNGPGDPGHYSAKIGPITKNVWYDFVYNVKWSSGSDGYIKGWVNGGLKLDYKGPTLYAGQGCYLKLANYHSPMGAPVSVIHDRIVRGASASAVSTRELQ